MRQNSYVVTVVGSVGADTTVAVRAKSKQDAARIALDGVDCEKGAWLLHPSHYYDLAVSDVDEVQDVDELRYVDQKHLLAT